MTFNKNLILVAEQLVKSVKINRPILLFSIFITVASFFLFLLQLASTNVTKLLELSSSTPWGVFTSILLHRSWDHLGANIGTLWLWTSYILLLGSLLSDTERKRRAIFFIPAVLASAIFSEIIWVVGINYFRPGLEYTSVGASGLVYAYLGVALGFALMNMQDAIVKSKSKETPKKRIESVIVSNAVFVAILVSIVVYSPSLFLSEAPNTNVFVHALAFLLGLTLVLGRGVIFPTLKAVRI